MSKKKGLKGASISVPVVKKSEKAIEKNAFTERGGEAAASDVGKRVRKRHAFEFYIDQLEKLNLLSAKKQMETGKTVSKSSLVRAALDAYLDKELKVK